MGCGASRCVHSSSDEQLPSGPNLSPLLRPFLLLSPSSHSHHHHHHYLQAILCTGGTGIFQRHNFEGMWTLAENEEISGGHPHYEHRTPNGQVVHLFHVNSAYGGAPRWVIGPVPGNENGWGFVDTSGTA